MKNLTLNQIRSAFKTIKIFLLFLCSVFLFLTLTTFKYIERKDREIRTRATDNAIFKSQSLQELNMICTDVRLPNGFTFISKGGIDDQKLSLSYYYSSPLPFDKARKTFEQYFAEKGWSEKDLSHRYPKQLDFTNNEYRIAINYSSGSMSNYSVYCEKLNN